jgi:hypothetical protein
MDRKDEMMQKIQSLKHDFSKLVPTTIELMFDACLGIICEEFALKNAEYDAIEKRAGSNTRFGIVRARNEQEFQASRQLLHRLKERLMKMYGEVRDGKTVDKDQESSTKKTNSHGRSRTRKPTTDGEGST